MRPQHPEPDPIPSPMHRHLSAVPAPHLSTAPVGLLRAALAGDDRWAMFVRRLAARVGGIDALEQFDAEPWPDEPFEWACVDHRDGAFVEEVLPAIDRCCDLLLDVEYRTIVRRLLALVASHDPRPLRRGLQPARCAAALLWLALHGSGEFRRGGLRAQDLWDWFRVSRSVDLGRRLRTAAGLPPGDDEAGGQDEFWKEILLGDVRVLHSRYRSLLRTMRSSTEQYLEREVFGGGADGSIRVLGDGRLDVAAIPVDLCWANKGMTRAGQAHVVLALRQPADEPDLLLALTVPETHRLAGALQQALDISLLHFSP